MEMNQKEVNMGGNLSAEFENVKGIIEAQEEVLVDGTFTVTGSAFLTLFCC